jgi:hypothetical protein
VLVYELLDEVIDFGVVQSTTTEALKGFVHEAAVQVEETAPDSAIERMIVCTHSTLFSRRSQDPAANSPSHCPVNHCEPLRAGFWSQ